LVTNPRADSPSRYLVATEDRAIPRAAQRTMARRARSTVSELAATHAVYITQPASVTTLIEQAAAAAMADRA
jgi:hypothetical protein